MKNVLFLDIDGVLNCHQFYRNHQIKDYEEVRQKMLGNIPIGKTERLEFYKSLLCPDRIDLLNQLCKETETSIVVSSTWRLNKTVEQLQEIFNYAGAAFTILDKTEHTGCERGTEISKWLKDNCMKYFGINHTDFVKYVILDDRNEMLLKQEIHFFQTDSHSGLTPDICSRIKNFLTH
jgi:hypothetical protein